MITKSIEGSITKTYIQKPMLCRGEYKWADNGGLKRNDGPVKKTMLF